MQVEDFTFGVDENGAEYVEFVENPSKTRQSGLSAKPRSFLPKMFSTGDERCPVKPVRVKDGMSLWHGMWHDLRNGIIMQNVILAE